MNVSDLYIKLTDPTGKHQPIISHHRVWDGKLFIAERRKQFEQCDKPEDRRTVSLATEQEYRKFMNYRVI